MCFLQFRGNHSASFFFEHHVARFFWNIAYISFGFQQPHSIANLFGSCIRSFPSKLRSQILVEASVLCWAIWLCRNDVVFKRTNPNLYLQIIFRGTYWIRCWAQLSKEEAKNRLMESSRRMEVTAMELFNDLGQNCRNRIKDQILVSICFSLLSAPVISVSSGVVSSLSTAVWCNLLAASFQT